MHPNLINSRLIEVKYVCIARTALNTFVKEIAVGTLKACIYPNCLHKYIPIPYKLKPAKSTLTQYM